MKCWMRRLRIELISQQNQEKIVIGDNGDRQTTRKYKFGVPSPANNDNLSIKVVGTKYPATNKDKGTLTIYNLTYETMVRIKIGKYYKIRILCGYQSWNEEPFPIFEGEVAYISSKIYSAHDTECYIVFASTLVAKYSQNRINFTLSSGMNVFAVMNYMLKAQGASKINLDSNLKQCFINETKQEFGKAATILESATLANTGDYTISTDGVDGNVIDVTTTKGKRVISIDKDSIPIGAGNPTVSSEGLQMVLLPIMNLKVGDILKIPRELIDISISNAESVTSTFNANYMDQNGLYMIWQLDYTLENRGSTFQYNIKGRALDVLKNLSGVSGN